MKKKTIFEALREYLKKKPVTQEEIEQLKLESQKYRLQADIARSKAIIKKSKESSSNILNDIFGSPVSPRNSNPKQHDFGFFEKDSKEKENLRKRTLGY